MDGSGGISEALGFLEGALGADRELRRRGRECTTDGQRSSKHDEDDRELKYGRSRLSWA